MDRIVIADSDGNIIVNRPLKEGESHTEAFKQEEYKYLKSKRDGN